MFYILLCLFSSITVVQQVLSFLLCAVVFIVLLAHLFVDF